MLPAEIVRQVKRIQIETGRQVADVMAGAYLSVFRGRGMEFDEVRPYVPGDDVRSIDWNVTARTGAPFVKRYLEERELTVLLLVDVSASQDFGSGRRSKREAAAELSALIAFSAIQNEDKVGLLLFHGRAEEYIPPRKGQKHALRVIRQVLAAGEERPAAPRRRWRWPAWERFRAARAPSSRRATDIAGALEFCRRVLPRRAVLFLISDFIDEGFMPAVRSAGRRHDLVAVQVLDAREREVERAGLLRLEDAETFDLALVDTGSAAFREALREASAKRLATLETELRRARVDLMRIDAAGSVVEPLLAFFRMRRKRLRR